MKKKILTVVSLIACSTFSFPALSDELDSTKAALDSVALHAQAWQYGWTAFFTGSLAIQTHTLASSSSSAEQKFDAKVSFVTASSGLLSVLVNPLEAAFLTDFQKLPEHNVSDRKTKTEYGQNIWEKSRREVERRRSWPFQAFLVTEQIVAAGAIAWIDKRPKDATMRFLLGMVTSEIFVFTTPRFAESGSETVSWQVSPQGVSVTWSF